MATAESCIHRRVKDAIVAGDERGTELISRVVRHGEGAGDRLRVPETEEAADVHVGGFLRVVACHRRPEA